MIRRKDRGPGDLEPEGPRGLAETRDCALHCRCMFFSLLVRDAVLCCRDFVSVSAWYKYLQEHSPLMFHVIPSAHIIYLLAWRAASARRKEDGVGVGVAIQAIARNKY